MIAHWFSAWFNLSGTGKRFASSYDIGAYDGERDGSDSNCSDSGNVGGAFQRPQTSDSPQDEAKNSTTYPSPNISLGPPLHQSPHLLPYLYPTGLYPPPPMSLLHAPAGAINPALNPSLLFNAQLALAAQHPALFGHYTTHAGHTPPSTAAITATSTSALHGLTKHRFAPYNLPGLGSAFDAVTPTSSISGGQRSLSSSPRPRPSSISPPMRPLSASSTSSKTIRVTDAPTSATPPTVPPPTSSSEKTTPVPSITASSSVASPTTSGLKSIEKMVDGLESKGDLTLAESAKVEQ
ncbi:hypothetical protein DMENIID0001_059200 [Sergentomyia squamirostris]